MRAKTRFAASMVKSTSSSVCLRPVKPASYCEGARYTPSSSIPRCHRANLSVSDLVASWKFFTGPSQKNNPNIPRMFPPHISCPASLPAARIPWISRVVILSMCSYVPSSARILSVSMPATMASGLPESVPAWYMGPAGATTSMMSRRPPYAPTGSPPPITLPMVVRSGVTPQYSCALPLEMRKPVITSSKHKSVPSAFVTSRRPSRKDLSGTMKPELPTTGSRMTPAISPLFSSKMRFTASRSL
mmetsp:Transcript_23596/g.58492  ORF Transcript_23596/g.58492 Transcript_23596/m.58492 type:complete len:245 (-) Transcript_23596:776-1510(-)